MSFQIYNWSVKIDILRGIRKFLAIRFAVTPQEAISRPPQESLLDPSGSIGSPKRSPWATLGARNPEMGYHREPQKLDINSDH